MEENERISDLFERARNEAPKTSFEEVKKHVIAASAVGGAGIVAKLTSISFKLKVIIMLVTLSTLTISGILIVTQLNSTVESKLVNHKTVQTQNNKNLKIFSENGIQKTVHYDENNQVLEVILDSSDANNSSDKNFEESIDVLPFESINAISDEKDGTGIVNQPVSINSGDSLVMRRFDFSDKTTEDELEAFSSAAQAAGIRIDYTARIRRNSVKRLSLVMSLTEEGKRKCERACVYKADSFTFQTGWMEDSEGNAVRFLKDDECKPLRARY